MALLTALVLLTFAPVAHYPFLVTDDSDYVSANPVISRGLTTAGVRWALTSFHASNWHPLTWFSHMLDVQLFGFNSGAHHLVSIVLHLLNALLLFSALGRMSGDRRRSFLIAALFAVHPLRVESVAWIAQRKDVLAGLFWMLAMHAYLRYVQRPRARGYLAVCALLALGLAAKQTLVALPFVLLLLDFWPLGRWQQAGVGPAPLARRPGRTVVFLAAEKGPLFLMAGIASTFALLAQRAGGSLGSFEDIPFTVRAANAIVSYATYLGGTLYPVDLAVFYPHPGAFLPASSIAGASLLLVGASLLAVRQSRRRPWLVTGWVWFVVTLVPVIGFIQVGAQARADRYTYLPLIGVYIIVAWSLPKPTRISQSWARAIWAAAYCAVIVLAVIARHQLNYWKSSGALFAHAVAVTPPNWSARFGLGAAREAEGRIPEAIEQYRESLRLNPAFADAHYNLGSLLGKMGVIPEAIAHLEAAVRLAPAFADAHGNLGKALLVAGETEAAISHLLTAERLDPANGKTQLNLAQALERVGRGEEAQRHYRESVRLGRRAFPRGP